jgi:iron complex outermembrane receptor protein
MTKARHSFRQALLRAGACALAAAVLPAGLAHADNSPAQVNLGLGQAAGATQSESVIVKAQTRLLKEKNSPSAVTELGAKQIATTGVAGSTGQLLRQAPSVYVYQQGLGDNAPELTVRGVRGLEIATTLDGIPTQDLEAPGNFYLSNNIGATFTLNQITNVSIYPGVAYPDKATFGTIGGTIAFDSKRPTNDSYFDVTGSVGSFGTYVEGFEANSGAYDSPLGTGDNAAKVLLNYRNLQTQGFIDGTPNRENEMEFAFDKPYNDGLSKFQATVIYNTADGLIQSEPVPVPYLDKNGFFSNYPTNLDFVKQNNDFLTIILKDDTYINDYLNVGLATFYLGNDQQTETYGAIQQFLPNVNSPTPLSVPFDGTQAQPFINVPAAFGEAGLFGPPVGGGGLGIYGGGTGGYFYYPGETFNPNKLYPPGSKYCPKSYAAIWQAYENGVAGLNPCGLNDSISGAHSDTYGIQPRVEVLLPEYFGIANSIKVGGLFAKETTPTGYSYLGGGPGTAQTPQNETAPQSGGDQRTIFQGYAQDKVDFLEDTLHITPGGIVEGTYSSLEGGLVFNSPLSPFYGPNGLANGGTNIDRYGPFKAKKWDREYLPFFNVTYDFDKILPAAKGLQAYGSLGTSALFAPVSDFGPNTASGVPNASIVHLYEGGVKYNTPTLLLSADYFYQKVDRDFGYFNNQNPGPTFGDNYFTNDGQREFKGFEAAATWQVTPNIQLFGNVSHLLAKYLKSALASVTVSEDQFGVGIKGDPVSGIPDWLSTFGIDYSRKSTLMDSDALNVRFTGQYTGHQATTYDLQGAQVYTVPGLQGVNYSTLPNGQPGPNNTQAAFLTGATVYNPNGGIAPFATFSLDANYTLPTPYMPILKKVTFDLNVQNIFDQRFFQYFYQQISPAASCPVTKSNPTGSIYGCGPANLTDGIPGEPFTVLFTVTARF